MAIFRQQPSNGNPGGVGKNRDSRLASWSVINNFDRRVIYSTKGARPFIAQTATHQWILFMTGIDKYAEENAPGIVQAQIVLAVVNTTNFGYTTWSSIKYDDQVNKIWQY